MLNTKALEEYLNANFPFHEGKWIITKNTLDKTLHAIILAKETEIQNSGAKKTYYKLYSAVKSPYSNEINYELLFSEWGDRSIRVFLKCFPSILKPKV